MSSPNPNRGHRIRLREQFLKSGFKGFHEYEIVELLLTLATPRKDCKPQAKALIRKFKNVRGVLEADSSLQQEVSGIGAHNIFGLKLAQHISEYILKQKVVNKTIVHSAQDVVDYLSVSMRGLKREEFKVLFLDIKNRILAIETLFTGTIDTSPIYPREIIKKALRYDAAAIIVVHNHPSGNPAPSANDKAATRDLIAAARMMKIKFLDHIVIGENTFYSFADKGLMKGYEKSV